MYLAGMQKPDHSSIIAYRHDFLDELIVSFTCIIQTIMLLGIEKVSELSSDSGKSMMPDSPIDKEELEIVKLVLNQC